MGTAATLSESEFMHLAPGVGIIPETYRNQAYTKLEFKPGEGGLGESLQNQAQAASDGNHMQAFLAGVAAGADPKQLAEKLIDKPGRGRGGKS